MCHTFDIDYMSIATGNETGLLSFRFKSIISFRFLSVVYIATVYIATDADNGFEHADATILLGHWGFVSVNIWATYWWVPFVLILTVQNVKLTGLRNQSNRR